MAATKKSMDVVAVLKACAEQKNLHQGIEVHTEIVKEGLSEINSHVASALVNMYARCGALAKAASVLDELPVRDVVTWNALIGGCFKQDQARGALSYFNWMQREGCIPDTVTFTCALKVCGSIGAIDRGREIHDEIRRLGLVQKNVVLGTTLIDMYVKCRALAKALQLIDELPVRNVVTWSALIDGYAQQGQGKEALKCLKRMQHEGLTPNMVTYTSILKAFGRMGAVDEGEQLHCEIERQGLLTKDTALGNTLVDMYCKCGALSKARKVFEELPIRDVVSWSALIAGYVQQDQDHEALKCFEKVENEGLFPSSAIFTSVLRACGSIKAIDKGEHIHRQIAHLGLLGKDIVLDTTLVDMYAKCGVLGKAAQVLGGLRVRDVVCWNVLLAGYIQEGLSEEALKCFEWMQRDCVSPDAVTFICILKACANIGAAETGEQIHKAILQQGLLGKDLLLGTTLVDMYAKCGSLAKAALVLEELPAWDLVSWSVLIAGYVQQGQGNEAIKCFERMQCEGVAPNAVTLAYVLCACSRSNLLGKGQKYFTVMSTKYGIMPDVEHCSCMVDLFGRVGEFDKALAIIKKTPSTDHLPLWLALLGACQICGNVNLGRLAFNNAVQANKNDGAAYVLISNICAAAGLRMNEASIKAK